MFEDYQIRSVQKPDDAVWEAVGGGLDTYNTQQAGAQNWKRVCIVLYASDGSVAGGLIGEIHWDWLYISLLIVKEELRGQGFGHRLLECAEDEAREQGAKNAYLDTFSFQAPEFYKQHGYEVFGTLNEFPPGHQRYYFTKAL